MHQDDSQLFISGSAIRSDWHVQLLALLNGQAAKVVPPVRNLNINGPQGASQDVGQRPVGLNGPVGAGNNKGSYNLQSGNGVQDKVGNGSEVQAGKMMDGETPLNPLNQQKNSGENLGDEGGPQGSDSRPDQGNVGPKQERSHQEGKFSFLFGPGGTLKHNAVGNDKEPGVFDNRVRESWLRIIAGKRAGLNMQCSLGNDNAHQGKGPSEEVQWQALTRLELWATRPSKN